uniref:Apple domain-containing protein n=1 Tax=Caenorhabditis japonica TaxID=281687 RepID=A0A8R1DS43_CAEJA
MTKRWRLIFITRGEINLATVKECATFCSQREFCRSAVYNTRTKTCGISYEYTVACASRTQRFKEFELNSDEGSDLVQIACVDACRDNNKRKVPVGIITGEPNNGERRESNVITDPLTTSSVSSKISETSSSSLASSTKSNADRPRAEGYVTRLILANITGLQEGRTGSVEPLTLQQNDASVAKHGKGSGGNKEKGPVCYRTIRHRYLLGASFAEHDVDSVNDCRCLCAATHATNDEKYKCQSFQFRNKTCTLNRGNHLGQYDLIEQRKTLYQYVGCDPEILVETAASKCPNFKASRQVPEVETTTTKKPKVELITAATVEKEKEKEKEKKNKNKNKTTTVKPTTKNTKKVTTTTEQPTTEKPEKSELPTGNDVEESDNTPSEMIIKKNGCFEVIDDHLMVSVAGGLEHDVSVEECQCLCANSKKSGRYEFQCRSATYYHTEKDCILNLEDRVMKSKFFERQFTSLNVSYIGMTCDIDESLKSIESLAEAQCKTPIESTTVLPKKTLEAKKNGLKSDECYVELNDFVLEGTAIAVETSVTAEECKCKCAEGQKLYGEDCASFLYYYDSKTCLINKQNRFSNPEKFNFVPSVNQSRSYFEWVCANKDDARIKYLSDTCKVESEKVEGNLLNHESEPVEVKKDENMEKKQEDDNDTGRMKRLDEKEFLDKIEKVVENNENNEKNEKTEQTVNNKSEHILDKEEVLKKIEEVEASTEKVTTTTEEPTTITEEVTTTTEEVSTTTKKEEVEMKKVDEKVLMEKINEAVESLEKFESTTSEELISSTEQSTTTTAKLVLNKKKNTLKETKKPGDLDPDHGRNATVIMRKVNEKSLESLIKKQVAPEATTESLEIEEVKNDPAKVQMKKVKAEVLEKIANMEVTPGMLEEEIVTEEAPEAPAEKLQKPKKYSIPEAEGLEDDDVEEEVGDELSTGLEDATTRAAEPQVESETIAPETTPAEEVTTTTKPKASGVKTHKFDDKVDKSGMPLPRIATTTEPTTTTAGYPPAGRCSYSALYQTSFLGRRLLKAVRVKSPADCFAACYALRCRSANLIAQGDLHNCELYRDSLIDYRRPDMIGYDAATVYFDGINCDGNN